MFTKLGRAVAWTIIKLKLFTGQDLVASVQYAGAFEVLQPLLLGVVIDSYASPSPPVRTCMALLSGALVPCLPLSQVYRHAHT